MFSNSSFSPSLSPSFLFSLPPSPLHFFFSLQPQTHHPVRTLITPLASGQQPPTNLFVLFALAHTPSPAPKSILHVAPSLIFPKSNPIVTPELQD